jgi:hypothetical protein
MGTSVVVTGSSVTVNGFEGHNPTITENMITVGVPEGFLEAGKGEVSLSIDRITGSMQFIQGKNKTSGTCRARAGRAF